MNLSTPNQNKLSEKGWQNMKILLDKELPEKKKRRTIVWLFLGLIFLGMATFHLWKNGNSSEKKSEVAKAPQILFANKSSGNQTNDINKDNNLILDEKEVIVLKENHVRTQNPKISLHANVLETNSQEGIKKPSFPTKYPLNVDSYNSSMTTANPAFVQEKEINATYYELNKTKEVVSNEKLTVPSLPILVSYLDKNAETIDMEAEFIKTKESQPKGFDLFLSGGLGSYTLKNVELNYLGVRTKQRLSNKLSLGTGLLYYSLSAQANNSLQDPNEVTTGNAESNTTFDGIVLEDADKSLDVFNPINTPGQHITVSIDKVKYLKMPILLEYKVNKRCEVFLGPQINYLTEISSNLSTANTNNTFYNISFNNNTVKRFYPSYTVGCRYSPWNRLTLDLAMNYDKKIVLSSNGSRVSALAGVSFRLF